MLQCAGRSELQKRGNERAVLPNSDMRRRRSKHRLFAYVAGHTYDYHPGISSHHAQTV